MNSRWWSIAALPAVLLCIAPAHGAEAPALASPSPLALATVSPDAGLVSADAATAVAPSVLCKDAGETAVLSSWNGTKYESIRYRPRRGSYRGRDRDRDWDESSRSSSGPTGFAQIHAGFLDPDGDPPSAFLAGVRAGGNIENRVQIGFGLDWSHRSDRATVLVTEVPIPGGGTAERQTVLAQSSANLVPMMAIVQFSPGLDLPFSPYFGAGGGYELLFLSAQDFATGDDFDATYGGWGWQVWGGATVPLSGNSRIAGEVFLNNAELERDVDDPSSGASLREIVSADGVGMRIGINWGF